MNKRLFLILLIAFSGPVFGQCIDSVIDLKKAQWRNKESKPKDEMMKRHSLPITRITIHYTAIKKNPKYDLKFKLRSVVNFSQNKRESFKPALWGDMPYHYYIDMTGQMGEGRDPKFRADTNTKYDPNGHITVVVEGDKTDDVSPAQKAKLFATIKALQNKYGIKAGGVGVHKHYTGDIDCPGPAVLAAVQEYRRLEANYIPDKTQCEQRPAEVPAQAKPVSKPTNSKTSTAKPAREGTKPVPAPSKSVPGGPRQSLPQENFSGGTSGSF